MERTKKVVTSAKFRTTDSPALLNTQDATRSVAVGCRLDESTQSMGLIGKVSEQSSGRNILDYGVWVDLSFPHVVGIFGTRGTGKSFDLGVFAESAGGLTGVVSGDSPSTSIVIFDVQDQFWTLQLPPNKNLPEDILHLKSLSDWGLSPTKLDNVKIWLPAGCKTSLLQTCDLRLSSSQLVESDWLALLELERYSPMGQALLTLLNDSGSKEPIDLANRAQVGQALANFQQGTIDALRWRLQALTHSQLVGEPCVDISQLLIPGQISVLLLRGLSESLRALTVGVIIRLFVSKMGTYHQARRFARRQGGEMPSGNLPERLWTIIDEAHVVAPREGKTAASESIVDYVKRGRDAGLSLVFATQQPSAVDNKLMSQVDITLTHALGFETDLQAAIARMPTRTSVVYERSGFKLPSFGDAIRSLDPGEAVIADSANGRVFIIRIRPRLSAHGGNTPAVGEKIDN